MIKINTISNNKNWKRYIENPEKFLSSNVLGTFNLLESVRNYYSKLKISKKDNLIDRMSKKTLTINTNMKINKIDDSTFSVQANKGTNLNSIFDFFDQEKIEILSMRNETNRLEELFLKLTNNDSERTS